MYRFFLQLLNLYYSIPFARTGDEYGIREIPGQVLETLTNERRELVTAQQNLRENRYPDIMNNPPTFDWLI